MTDTPARKPQEKCYIIKEDELNKLSTTKDTSAKFLISIRNQVRSRTHTSPPAPDEQMQISDIIKDLERSLKFYKDRINMLQCWQSSMRDPERKIVCDILANGFTLTTKEEVDNAAKAEREQVVEDVRTKLSKLKTAYPTGADFVWWLVIDVALNEVKESLRPQQGGVSK